LFRSDSLHELSEPDQAKLAAHGVRTIIDLRSIGEVSSATNQLERSTVIHYVHIPFGDLQLVAPSRSELYRLALRRRQREFRNVFAVLAGEGVLPAVVQCSAGRDRTGLVVALVLALVGVPSEVIAEDYALSVDSQSTLAASVPIDPILDTLNYLEMACGGAAEYLREIGVSDHEMHALRTALVQQPVFRSLGDASNRP
jgi:protein-tyrosine phosphatase